MENVVLNVKCPEGNKVRFLYERGKPAKTVIQKAKLYFDIGWDCVLVMADRPHQPLSPAYPIPISDIHSEHNLELLFSIE